VPVADWLPKSLTFGFVENKALTRYLASSSDGSYANPCTLIVNIVSCCSM
jgi:hypothetical protein